ncbi:MAG TPA: carboxypeptidase regulatory-like domain-containing protein [Pyrinomonadaceae bacterium]|nr:carboxypeptidase regulatory-like domain-containing protein [Pyrinomonadaceae bacterium]
MPFKLLFRTTAAALVLAVCTVAASAQVATATGKVTLKQADGTEVPIKDAQVDIYRTDIKGEYNLKTNSKGVYTHAGIPFVGTYTVAVSAPGARPAFDVNIRFSQRPELNFVLEPGDGSRLTLEQIKAAGTAPRAAAGTPGGNTAAAAAPKESDEERKKRLAEIARIEEQNKNITSANETVKRTFEAGNKALTEKRYDEAINFFNEGLAAREDSGLFINRAVALRNRGFEVYRKANPLPAAERAPLMATAVKDFTAAAESASKALEVIKASASDPNDPNKATLEQNKKAALGERAENLRLIVLLADKSKADEAVAAYQEYFPMLTDPAEQGRARLYTAELLFEVGAYKANNSKGNEGFPAAIENFKQSQAEYLKVLEVQPDNADALAKIGLAYIQIGYLSNPPDDKMLQEGANYLQKFADKAPDTHPLKADAVAQIQALKSMNIVPKKVEAPARNTGRRRG